MAISSSFHDPRFYSLSISVIVKASSGPRYVVGFITDSILMSKQGHEKKPAAGVDSNLHEEADLVAEHGKPVNDHNTPDINFPDTVVPGTPKLDRKLGAPAKRFSPPSAGDC
ncbi:unnamed protein product [Lactuca virosa]|uniref:Uncharacterized protein n=1 Tax=Lactuca virosa TaxID=75947 RepID=A0AAU9MHV0_9ASTR|nr:unnamed protein product [Lactuca virosa]